CLTYTPDNPAGWQVEAGNVGLHYYEWRYGTERPVPPVESVRFHIHYGGAQVGQTVTHETFLNSTAVGTWATTNTDGNEISHGTLVAEHPAGQVLGYITQTWPFLGSGTMTFNYDISLGG